jgi:hypothetical protein
LVNDELVRRVLAEERLRLAVQAEFLGAQQPSSPAISRFLNSALGLLLVSSVVVAGLGRLYADYRQRLTDRAARVAQLERLITEIDYRISQIELGIPNVPYREQSSPVPQENRQGVWQVATGTGSFQAAWPEFKNVPIYGLMSRLSREAQVDPSAYARQAALTFANPDVPWTAQDARRHVSALKKYRAVLLSEL